MPTIQEAHILHAKYYVGVLREADTLYKKGGDEVRKSLSLTQTEWDNIASAQLWFQSQTEKEHAFARLGSNFASAGVYVLSIFLPPLAYIPWIEMGLKASRLLGDRAIEANHLGSLGNAYAALGMLRSAISF